MKNKIELHTIAIHNNKEYELQDLLNGLLEEINKKNNIINELKEWLEKEKENYNLELTKKNEGALSYSLPIKNIYRQVLDKIEELESGE